MGLVACILVVAFNLITLRIPHLKTPWGTLKARSDAFDAFRWCVNFPIDIFILWSIEAELASIVSIWLLLTFGAMTEVYARKYKLITVTAAFISFAVLILWLNPTETKTSIYVLACYASMVFILWKLQQYVGDEMSRVIREEVERKQLESEAERLQRDAAIGHSTRAINHELNTLIGVANMSAYQIQSKHDSDDMATEINRLHRSLNYMGRVSSLILDGLGNRNANKRIISVSELYDDLNLLLCIDNDRYQQDVSFQFCDTALPLHFEERTGSTYLIIHNLVKNAHDSVSEKYGRSNDGIIKLEAGYRDGQIVISVFDNGVGLSGEAIDDILQQKGVSTKINGHGLGMRFVCNECDKNQMTLNIDSTVGEYALFTVSIPVKNA